MRWGPVGTTAAVLLVAACSAPGSSPSSSPGDVSTPAPTAPRYEREAFGHGWLSIGKGCDVRDLVLARDLRPAQRRGCDVVGGVLRDPYTGRVVTGPSRALDVDHVVPLAHAWELGAWRWPEEERLAFANDLENLRTTTASANRSKGDQDLSEWLPAVDPCGYARRFDAVADRWDLVDPSRDDEVAGACP